MNSEQIQEAVYQWALSKNFTAPYGVLPGEFTSKKGTKYRSVTFGRARTLDATVEIYNRKFMILRTSAFDSQVFNDFDSLMKICSSTIKQIWITSRSALAKIACADLTCVSKAPISA